MKDLLTSKAFYAGLLCAVVIAAIAMAASRSLDLSASSAYKTESVRL